MLHLLITVQAFIYRQSIFLIDFYGDNIPENCLTDFKNTMLNNYFVNILLTCIFMVHEILHIKTVINSKHLFKLLSFIIQHCLQQLS